MTEDRDAIHKSLDRGLSKLLERLEDERIDSLLEPAVKHVMRRGGGLEYEVSFTVDRDGDAVFVVGGSGEGWDAAIDDAMRSLPDGEAD